MTSTARTAKWTTIAGMSLAAVALAGSMGGCRGERSDDPPHQFLPDMDDSPKMKNQGETDFFVDGRQMRPRVKGTVPFGESADADAPGRESHLKASPEFYLGIDSSAAPASDGKPVYVKYIPGEVFEAYAQDHNLSGDAVFAAKLKRGQERFNIYCSACHGYQGEGGDPANFTGGVVGRRWAYPVPSFHQDKYRDRNNELGSDGYIFHVIQNGVPGTDGQPHKMPPYADKVNEADSWAIVAYVRALQGAWQEATPPATAPAAPASGQTEVKP